MKIIRQSTKISGKLKKHTARRFYSLSRNPAAVFTKQHCKLRLKTKRGHLLISIIISQLAQENWHEMIGESIRKQLNKLTDDDQLS